MANLYALLKGNQEKPLDVGCGTISASIGPDGKFYSINRFHPKHGFVSLISLEPFPNDKWYDSEFVRTYRKRIAGENIFSGEPFGFGFLPSEEILQSDYYYSDFREPVIIFHLDGINVQSRFTAVENNGSPYLIQRILITNVSGWDRIFTYEIGGRLSLNRCSYGQLTEGGPLYLPEQVNDVRIQGNRISIVNPNLGARADLFVFVDDEPVQFSGLHSVSKEPVPYGESKRIVLNKGEERHIDIVHILAPTEEFRERAFSTVFPQDAGVKLERQPDIVEFIVRRNLDYILSCCSVPTVNGAICVITDHQLLPLSWNRDAYYMMQLLMEAEKKQGFLSADIEERTKLIVKGHLIWMFQQANRPQGFWGRAYLTNGYSKDNVFQLDQQCYPLLELCDYTAWTGDEEMIHRITPVVKDILEVILKNRDAVKWVFRTGETPADDKVDYPYHFSSQVLLYHTFNRLGELNRKFGFSEHDFSKWAERVKHDCLESFTVTHDGKEMFAYLTDLKGNHQKYYDANDLPTVYAPKWGFCGADDPKWINMMRFAFSKENMGGFYDGELGGLGSVHTPHPWPLGDAQELAFAAVIRDEDRCFRIVNRLKRIVQWDGLFSEAIDEHTGKVVSRHWFSWPGAFISTLLLR
jgi:hypothetical protein